MTVKTYLQNIAGKIRCSEYPDFNTYDYSGGSFNDAFSMGQTDGEIGLAREILAKLESGELEEREP